METSNDVASGLKNADGTSINYTDVTTTGSNADIQYIRHAGRFATVTPSGSGVTSTTISTYNAVATQTSAKADPNFNFDNSSLTAYTGSAVSIKNGIVLAAKLIVTNSQGSSEDFTNPLATGATAAQTTRAADTTSYMGSGEGNVVSNNASYLITPSKEKPALPSSITLETTIDGASVTTAEPANLKIPFMTLDNLGGWRVPSSGGGSSVHVGQAALTATAFQGSTDASNIMDKNATANDGTTHVTLPIHNETTATALTSLKPGFAISFKVQIPKGTTINNGAVKVQGGDTNTFVGKVSDSVTVTNASGITAAVHANVDEVQGMTATTTPGTAGNDDATVSINFANPSNKSTGFDPNAANNKGSDISLAITSIEAYLFDLSWTSMGGAFGSADRNDPKKIIAKTQKPRMTLVGGNFKTASNVNFGAVNTITWTGLKKDGIYIPYVRVNYTLELTLLCQEHPTYFLGQIV